MQAGVQESAAKELFLQMVREALGRNTPLLHVPDHPALKTTLPRHQEKVVTIQAKVEARRSALATRLMETATAAGWHVHRVASENEAALMVGEIARGLGARRAVRTNEDVFRRVDVDLALRSARIAPIVLAAGRQRRRGELRALALQADLGISGVEYAVAETGSCVVVPRRGVARMTTLTPPALVVLVEAAQVLENLDDLLAIWRLENLRTRGRMPNYMTLVSGPSRTADIEFTLSTGVHGPGRAYLILIA